MVFTGVPFSHISFPFMVANRSEMLSLLLKSMVAAAIHQGPSIVLWRAVVPSHYHPHHPRCLVQGILASLIAGTCGSAAEIFASGVNKSVATS